MEWHFMKKLTLEAEGWKEEFESTYEDRGCSCNMSPPCSHCTHEGHPECLDNTDTAWNKVETVKVDDNNWMARYSAIPIEQTQTYGSGSTEQEAVDNLPTLDYLGVVK